MKRFVDTFSWAEQVADEARAVQERWLRREINESPQVTESANNDDECPSCNRPALVWRKCKQVCTACKAIIRTCGDL